MVIIKCNIHIKRDEFLALHTGLTEMAKTGVILLPAYCELLNEVPPDTEVAVVKEKGV